MCSSGATYILQHRLRNASSLRAPSVFRLTSRHRSRHASSEGGRSALNADVLLREALLVSADTKLLVYYPFRRSFPCRAESVKYLVARDRALCGAVPFVLLPTCKPRATAGTSSFTIRRGATSLRHLENIGFWPSSWLAITALNGL